MLRRIGAVLLSLILLAIVVVGAIWVYDYFNSDNNSISEGMQISADEVDEPEVPADVTDTPADEVDEPEVPADVTDTPADEVDELEVPADVTDTSTDEAGESEVPVVPVEVTPAPTEVVVPEINVNVISLYTNNNGYLFAFTQKNASKVTKIIDVEHAGNVLRLKNGRVYEPVKAWNKNDISVEAIVEEIIVKNEALYTNPYEIVAKTVMHSEYGHAHRLFEEGKSGQLIVTFKITIDNKEWKLEVWYQENEYVLRRYAEAAPVVTAPPPTNTPAPPTNTPVPPTATPQIPTNEPTATPTIPMEEPTATPTIPTNEPTATPQIPTGGDIDWGFEDGDGGNDGDIDWGFEDGNGGNDGNVDWGLGNDSGNTGDIDWGFE